VGKIKFVVESVEREFQELSISIRGCCPDYLCDMHSEMADALVLSHLNDIVEIMDDGIKVTEKRYEDYVYEEIRKGD